LEFTSFAITFKDRKFFKKLTPLSAGQLSSNLQSTICNHQLVIFQNKNNSLSDINSDLSISFYVRSSFIREKHRKGKS